MYIYIYIYIHTYIHTPLFDYIITTSILSHHYYISPLDRPDAGRAPRSTAARINITSIIIAIIISSSSSSIFEIEIFPPLSLQNHPKAAPDLFRGGVEYGAFDEKSAPRRSVMAGSAVAREVLAWRDM